MSDFPSLSPASEDVFDNPSRQSSPFPNLPFIVDAATLKDAVNRNAGEIFESIIAIMEELNRVREENENLQSDNQSLRENWQDVSLQVQENYKQLSSTQAELAKTQGGLSFALEDFGQRRQDWFKRAQRYEELMAIGSAKQVVLWKYVERIENGLTPTNSGNWATVPPLTGTHMTPTAFDSEESDSTVTEFKGSPERMSRATTRRGASKGNTGLETEMSRARGRGSGSPGRGVFNPAAVGRWNPARLELADLSNRIHSCLVVEAQQKAFSQQQVQLKPLNTSTSSPASYLSHLVSLASVQTHCAHLPSTDVRYHLAASNMSAKPITTRRVKVARIRNASLFMSIDPAMKKLMDSDVDSRVSAEIAVRG